LKTCEQHSYRIQRRVFLLAVHDISTPSKHILTLRQMLCCLQTLVPLVALQAGNIWNLRKR